MSNKKILIVTSGFYPQNSPRAHRATELAKELARQGHQVTVLLHDRLPNHDAFEKEHNVVIKSMGDRKWKNPDFGKSKVGYFMTRLWFRFFMHAFEYPGIELSFMVDKALKKEKGYDLLISIAVPYPIHWGVAKSWKKGQNIAKTWVADCGDPYYGNKTDSFRKWPHFALVEKWFMRKVDFITIPIEGAKDTYFKEFHSKIKVIPQGFKLNDIGYKGLYKGNEVSTFLYAGGFIQGRRDPRKFLDFLSKVKGDYRFYIYTNKFELIESYQDKIGNKIIIHKYIPREELLEKMATMDFLVNFDNNTSTALPSKLIDYSLVNRPVLNIKRDLDTENIQRFLKGDYSGQMNLPNFDNYWIEKICHQFLDLIEEDPQ